MCESSRSTALCVRAAIPLKTMMSEREMDALGEGELSTVGPPLDHIHTAHTHCSEPHSPPPRHRITPCSWCMMTSLEYLVKCPFSRASTVYLNYFLPLPLSRSTGLVAGMRALAPPCALCEKT
jgi:hypothetical protein